MRAVDESGVRLALADEATWAGDIDGAVAHLSAAVSEFTAAGDKRQAAMACARLGLVYGFGMGNKVAARPWFIRAARLLEDEEPCVEQGWVAVAAVGCDVDDPAVLLERAEVALELARRFGDVNLETKALADGGLALVEAGRVTEGMAMIDEAMALVCGGGADDADVAGQSVCSFFTACHFTGDLERVEAWSPVLRQRGLVGARSGPAALVGSHCDSVQGTLLCRLGRWGEAEHVLEQALAATQDAMTVPAASIHPATALADLRILQGRLDEAEALLLGRDDVMEALLPTARLHLARGDHDLAAATARRGLRLMGDDRVRAGSLLGVLVEAELGRGDIERAAEASADLDARTTGIGLAALTAEAARLRARVHHARGQTDEAITAAHDAMRALAGVELPWMKVSLHLGLARLIDVAGDRPAAVVEARAAAAVLRRVDVVLTADDEALLRSLGVALAPAASATGCRVATLVPEGSWWSAGCDQTSVRFRDTKGLRYLAELIANPGVERHALDLVDLVEGLPPTDSGLDRRRLGDAGPLLDRQARAAYRHRAEELKDEVEEALAVEDDDRAARSQTELDAIVTELARAVGLGGRDRWAWSAAEKARLNVTRALRAATARLTEALPEPGAVLDRRVRTGLFCAYIPRPEDEVVWSVQSRLNGGARD
ncbi:MAG: tetratricopeptide repeat protein [Acidimicrobiales bacterium]